MLECIDCGYIGNVFDVCVSDIYMGAFRYVAICPRCKSRKIQSLPGYYEKELKIGFNYPGSLPAAGNDNLNYHLQLL